MRTVLITGANRGLGLETAKQLLEKGFFVYLGMRDTSKAEKLVNELSSISKEFKLLELDILKNSQIRDALSEIRNAGHSLDILINNAGVFIESTGPNDQTTSSILKVDSAIVLKTIETNTIGALKMIQFFVPFMLEHGGGRIINVSSGMGQLEHMKGHWPGYRMSKTGMNVLTKVLDEEMHEKNIIVNSVCPGWVRTDMGGENALLSISEGVDSIVWLSTISNSPRGKFIQNRKVIEW